MLLGRGCACLVRMPYQCHESIFSPNSQQGIYHSRMPPKQSAAHCLQPVPDIHEPGISNLAVVSIFIGPYVRQCKVATFRSCLQQWTATVYLAASVSSESRTCHYSIGFSHLIRPMLRSVQPSLKRSDVLVKRLELATLLTKHRVTSAICLPA